MKTSVIQHSKHFLCKADNNATRFVETVPEKCWLSTAYFWECECLKEPLQKPNNRNFTMCFLQVYCNRLRYTVLCRCSWYCIHPLWLLSVWDRCTLLDNHTKIPFELLDSAKMGESAQFHVYPFKGIKTVTQSTSNFSVSPNMDMITALDPLNYNIKTNLLHYVLSYSQQGGLWKWKEQGKKYYLDPAGVKLPLVYKKVNSAGRGLAESLSRTSWASEPDEGWLTHSRHDIKCAFHQISSGQKEWKGKAGIFTDSKACFWQSTGSAVIQQVWGVGSLCCARLNM